MSINATVQQNFEPIPLHGETRANFDPDQTSYRFMCQGEVAWRGAVALNNAAVSLAVRGCFAPALQLLRESLSLMQLCALDGARNRSVSADADFQNLFPRLQQSAKYIAQYSSQAQSLPLLENVRILDESVADFHSLDPLFNENTASCRQMLYLVRFESSTFYENNHGALEVHSAYLLYNMALVKLCHSQLTISNTFGSSDSHCLKLLKSSLALLMRNEVLDKPLPPTSIAVHAVALDLMFRALSLSSLSQSEGEIIAVTQALHQAQASYAQWSFVFTSLDSSSAAAAA